MEAVTSLEHYQCLIKQLDGTWQEVTAEDFVMMREMAIAFGGDLTMAIIER